MKRNVLLVTVLLVGIGLNIWAAKEVLIYEKYSSAVRTTPRSDIDSIGFKNGLYYYYSPELDEYVLIDTPELLFYKDYYISYRTNVNYIDSVVFSAPAPKGPPVIDMFYCEFVPAGGILRIAGKNFIDPVVYFYGENDNLIKASKVETKGFTELFVTVPEGITHSKPVIVENAAGKTTSKILFRDRRNIIIDFDNYRGFGGWLQDGEEAGFSFPTFRGENDFISYSPAKYCPDEYLTGDMANAASFPQGCSGNYNLLNAWDDSEWRAPNRVEFHIQETEADAMSENPRRSDPVLSKSLMGPFLNEYDVKSMVLKFEIYVPEAYPMNGAWLTISFPPAGGSAWDSNSSWSLTSPERGTNSLPLGWWCPFMADIDKTNGGKDDGIWKWSTGRDGCAKPFHTNDTWVTVSVPLSKIIYHGWVNPGSYLWKGDTGIPFDFSDDGNPALSPGTLSKDPTKSLGDMVVMYSVWSNKGNQLGKFMLFVDNFRLVPEDGGGVQFGRGEGQTRPYPGTDSDFNKIALSPVSSIVSVSGIDNDGFETPLTPNSEVTILGEHLDLVEKIIFPNGVEVVPVRQTATELTFLLPEEASDGVKMSILTSETGTKIVYGSNMSLVVPPKTAGGKIFYVATPTIYFDKEIDETYLNDLTATLYGGDIWLDYQGRFSWVVNEGLSGNLWNIWDEQGALFMGDVSPTNAHIKGGYISLYTVISRANFIINNVRDLAEGSSITEENINRAIAEAKMFRGMAYFLLTESWGEVPIILKDDGQNGCRYCNNSYEEILSNRQKANRASLYTLIEQDWQYASKNLPATLVENWRVTQYSAKGMLSKLYLTMASSQTDGLTCPYLCPDPQMYYQKAIDMADDVISNSGKSLESYAAVFDLNNQYTSSESLFALQFYDGGWGAGAHWQAMLAYDDFWAPGAGWGSWNNLTWTLLEAFHPGDLRKKETCFYAPTEKYGEKWYTWDGREGWPYNKYNTVKERSSGFSGSKIKNNIKKFVYGYDSTPNDAMSSPMRMDFLRLADVYMMRAEAKMAKAAGVTTRTMAGMDDLRTVVEQHGGQEALADLNQKLTDNGGMAFYEPVQFTREISYTYLGPYVDENGIDRFGFNLPENERLTASIKVPDFRIDFIQERRKEFAIEGQTWLDVKRLYYRCPQCAKDFFREQDRGWEYTQRWNETDIPEVTDKFPTINQDRMDGYVRTELLIAFCEKYPKIMTTDSQEARINQAIHNGAFDRWFLPVPATITLLPSPGGDFTEEILNGTYEY